MTIEPIEPADPDHVPSRADADAKLTTASLAGVAPSGHPAETRSFAEESETPPSEPAAPLFPTDEARGLRERWDAIQGSFVDEPRRAVEEADSLVAQAMKRLAETFADERAGLEGQWDRGDEVSTEDLRQALRRYRTFFGRLLAV